MGKTKIVARVIAEWTDGINSKPRLYSLADTYEEANELEAMVRRAIERELQINDKNKKGGREHE